MTRRRVTIAPSPSVQKYFKRQRGRAFAADLVAGLMTSSPNIMSRSHEYSSGALGAWDGTSIKVHNGDYRNDDNDWDVDLDFDDNNILRGLTLTHDPNKCAILIDRVKRNAFELYEQRYIGYLSALSAMEPAVAEVSAVSKKRK